jgi:hypothetical protein
MDTVKLISSSTQTINRSQAIDILSDLLIMKQVTTFLHEHVL